MSQDASTDQAIVTGTSDHHMQVDRVNSRPRKVLMVVANSAVSSNNGWPVGFWAAELTHPYYELTEAGFEDGAYLLPAARSPGSATSRRTSVTRPAACRSCPGGWRTSSRRAARTM